MLVGNTVFAVVLNVVEVVGKILVEVVKNLVEVEVGKILVEVEENCVEVEVGNEKNLDEVADGVESKKSIKQFCQITITSHENDK